MEQFLYWMGNAANLLSLLTLAVSILTYTKVKSEAKKLQRSLKNMPFTENLSELIELHEGIDSPRPVALVFSLIPNLGSIKPSVQDFLISKSWKMPIEEVELLGISPKNIPEFYEKVRQKKREIQEKGHTEVHLFIAGPIQAGTIIGNFLSKLDACKAISQGHCHI